MDEEILDRCRERVVCGSPVTWADCVSLVKSVVAAQWEVTELRCQLADAGVIVQDVWDANEHLNISAETSERHRRGELTWWPATMRDKDTDAPKTEATAAP